MENKDCCCKDIHRDTCFAIRYPNYDFLHAEHPETCECSCHDQYDEDECGCYDSDYPTKEDIEELKDDYELMKQLADDEVRAREQDAWEKQKELKREYPHKYSDEGE